MLNMNNFSGIGRLTADPNLKQLSLKNSKSDVVNFTIAIDRTHKDSNGNYNADFIRCSAWNHNARYLNKYGKKGSIICINGSIRTNKSYWSVRVTNLGLIYSSNQSNNSNNNTLENQNNNHTTSDNSSNSDDSNMLNDLPFN